MSQTFSETVRAITKEANASTAKLTPEQLRGVYERWIAFFDYTEGAEPDDTDPYSPEWGPREIVARVMEADPFMGVVQFLLNEGLVADKNAGTPDAATVCPPNEEAAARIRAINNKWANRRAP